MKFVFIFLLLFGCSSKEMKQYDQIMDASCGQCMFAMDEQVGCDLAVRIDTKAFFVKGAAIDDYGDAHAEDGFCNSIRKAKVKGYVQESIFIVTSLELLSAGSSSES